MKAPVLVGLFFVLLADHPYPSHFQGKCIGVTDGDTVSVMFLGRPETVRLEGIDSPEKGRPFSADAKRFMSGLVFGRVIDVYPVTRDKYGRCVARVTVDRKDVSTELVRAGYAWHFTKYSSDPLLAEEEVKARAAGRGMWKQTPAGQSADARAPSKGVDNRVIYRGNTGSRAFHSPSCSYYKCKKCTRVFKSREEAIAAGFHPCGECDP